MDYRETLNLPQTKFKMKANLTQREPQVLKRWDKEELYHKIQQAAKNRPLFLLHDGPPYANANIHLGTAFNKVLKDIVLRAKRLAGFNAPFVPGWDCHGLPIEHNVDKELGGKKKSIPPLAMRAACRSYAEKWIKVQKEEFKRLGVIGDWDAPYLTMNFSYEAIIAREFNRFLLSGAVIRSHKPVYWCSTCKTALAEAEVEYTDHTSPSVYVKFPLHDDLDIPELAGRKASIIIWTTTPWTLPANVAVAFHPEMVYAAVQVNDEVWILAKELVTSCMQIFGIADFAIITEFSAAGFEGKHCRHPFMERDSLLVLADYVTADSGTGCVHTAPGHGADDYQTGLRYGLEVLSPVDDLGIYTAEAGHYAGEQVPQVNSRIVADMEAEGVLVKAMLLNHSYPHCWRCKKPIIYRATAQWFISMDKLDLRQKALTAIGTAAWTPAWGEHRIANMVESRPDWCVSRQRAWGVPITVLSCKDCGEVLKNEETCRNIEERFMKEGADAWFRYEVADFLPTGCVCTCGGSNFQKESDILDVWFDSGVSHAAVLEQRPELTWPADLYLEGSDQHRGWFQSSLLTAVATRGSAPYRGVLTHGYVVDGQGKKMSKSVGNVVAPQEVINEYGAEVLRLWVSSENYQDDVKVSNEILRHVSDAYRKIRNTLRFLLGNIYDFDPQQHTMPMSGLMDLDRWALARFAELSDRVRRAYEQYEFHTVYSSLHTFCGTTISNIYLDVLKDRLYCSAPNSPERRAAQTAIYRILDGLLRLMSPILCFTAAEAWEHLYGLTDQSPLEDSIFFAAFPQVEDLRAEAAFMQRWDKLLTLRGAITRELEVVRRDKVIGLSLDAEVVLQVDDADWHNFLTANLAELQGLCIISSLRLLTPDETSTLPLTEAESPAGLRVAVGVAPGLKCERCWTFTLTVGTDSEHPSLCSRCADVVRILA